MLIATETFNQKTVVILSYYQMDWMHTAPLSNGVGDGAGRGEVGATVSSAQELTEKKYLFLVTPPFSGAMEHNTLKSEGTSNCGGNCPSGHCTTCPCGTVADYRSISDWCSRYSGWKQSSCECIMKQESGGNANEVDTDPEQTSYDVGLWQIDSYNWKSCSNGMAPCSPEVNLECAEKVFRWGGNTWKNWGACESCGVCNSN